MIFTAVFACYIACWNLTELRIYRMFTYLLCGKERRLFKTRTKLWNTDNLISFFLFCFYWRSNFLRFCGQINNIVFVLFYSVRFANIGSHLGSTDEKDREKWTYWKSNIKIRCRRKSCLALAPVDKYFWHCVLDQKKKQQLHSSCQFLFSGIHSRVYTTVSTGFKRH